MIEQVFTVRCERCGRQRIEHEATRPHLIAEARKAGWRVGDPHADDWCPGCLAEFQQALREGRAREFRPPLARYVVEALHDDEDRRR